MPCRPADRNPGICDAVLRPLAVRRWSCLPGSGRRGAGATRRGVAAERTLVRQLTAPLCEFMQLCTELRLGAVLDWLFESEAPVAFNTHFHEEGVVRYPEGISALTSAKAASHRRQPGPLLAVVQPRRRAGDQPDAHHAVNRTPFRGCRPS